MLTPLDARSVDKCNPRVLQTKKTRPASEAHLGVLGAPLSRALAALRAACLV
jgi:hypothetical protein